MPAKSRLTLFLYYTRLPQGVHADHAQATECYFCGQGFLESCASFVCAPRTGKIMEKFHEQVAAGSLKVDVPPTT